MLEWAGDRRDLEFQRLHGMGEGLYEDLMASRGLAVRIYAPVGGYRDLLAYLVRRLLENGANTSFVHQIADRDLPDEVLLADPVAVAEETGLTAHSAIPTPPNLYAPERRNSAGLDLSDEALVADLMDSMARTWATRGDAGPIVDGKDGVGAVRDMVDPADLSRSIGTVVEADAALVGEAISIAAHLQPEWDARGADARAAILERLADLLERDHAHLMALAIREAGKTLADALGEVREAVDFCRYYAVQARKHGEPVRLARDRPESSTSSAWPDGAWLPASARGISRWRSSSARSPRPSPPATPWSPSPRRRRR